MRHNTKNMQITQERKTMEIFLAFIIIAIIGLLIGFVGFFVRNDMAIIGYSVAIISLIFSVLFVCLEVITYGTAPT